MRLIALFKVLDLFSGAGGFSEGFRQAGFRIVGGLDNMKAMGETFKANFPEARFILADIQRVDARELIAEFGDVDIIIGGPPCEAFTAANFKRMPNPLDRLYKDPRGRLTLHFIRIIGDMKPKVFVMENVIQVAAGPLREALRREFRRVGYLNIYFNVLRAEDYGTPSRRTRMFISNIKIRPRKMRRRVTVWEAIGDLPDPRTYHDIPNHEYVPLSRKKFKRVMRLRWGESLITFVGADGAAKHNYIRLRPDQVAPPVMGKSRFIHPFQDRLLTVREHARLMGFPDSFIFYGGRNTQFDQVGEAVPIPLGKAIGLVIKNYLEGSS